MALRRRNHTIRSAVFEALKRSSLNRFQKLWVTWFLIVHPEAMESLSAMLLDAANTDLAMGLADAEAILTPEQWEKIIDFFIENILPILLELLIGLIGGTDA